MLRVRFVQKMRESWLKNDILFLIITFFNSILINMLFFRILCRISIVSETEGEIESFVDIMCVLNNIYLISEKRSIRLKG